MTFSRCIHCDETFSSYKRDEHTCQTNDKEADRG